MPAHRIARRRGGEGEPKPGEGRYAVSRRFSTLVSAAVAAAFGLAPAPASAQLELNYQYGSILNPLSAASEPTHIFTLQHAGGWRAGGSFFFLDYSIDGVADGFNDRDLYGEWYPTLSLGSLVEGGVGFGPVSDVRLVAGVNLGIQSKVVKYVPGVELGWNIPGFIFVNTILGGLIDASSGRDGGRGAEHGRQLQLRRQPGFPSSSWAVSRSRSPDTPNTWAPLQTRLGTNTRAAYLPNPSSDGMWDRR